MRVRNEEIYAFFAVKLKTKRNGTKAHRYYTRTNGSCGKRAVIIRAIISKSIAGRASSKGKSRGESQAIDDGARKMPAASSHAATCDKKQIAICFTDFHAFGFICTTETFINIKQKLKLKQ